MELDDFMRTTPPKAKRSRLEQYKTEIQTLRSRGYAVQQIQEWLAINGLKVTPSAVQQYIARHLKKPAATPDATAAPATNMPAETLHKVPLPAPVEQRPELALPKLSEETPRPRLAPASQRRRQASLDDDNPLANFGKPERSNKK